MENSWIIDGLKFLGTLMGSAITAYVAVRGLEARRRVDISAIESQEEIEREKIRASKLSAQTQAEESQEKIKNSLWERTQARLDAMQSELKQRDVRIAALESDLETERLRRSEQVAERDTRIAALEKRVGKFIQIVEEKDRLLVKLRTERDELERQVDLLKNGRIFK